MNVWSIVVTSKGLGRLTSRVAAASQIKGIFKSKPRSKLDKKTKTDKKYHRSSLLTEDKEMCAVVYGHGTFHKFNCTKYSATPNLGLDSVISE